MTLEIHSAFLQVIFLYKVKQEHGGCMKSIFRFGFNGDN